MRNVTDAFIAACNAQTSDECFILLVKIYHDDLSAPIYLNTSGENQVSNGIAYLACPMEITLAEDNDKRPPQIQLRIDNVDRTPVAAVRSITTPPTVDISLVKYSDLDTVEASFTGFTMREITYDVLTVEGTLIPENIYSEPACAYTFTPTHFPGLF